MKKVKWTNDEIRRKDDGKREIDSRSLGKEEGGRKRREEKKRYLKEIPLTERESTYYYVS